MAWKSVVFSRDPGVLAAVSPSLSELDIVPEIFSGQTLAIERVSRNKFDAVVFDCDAAVGVPGDELLRSMRQGSLNSRLVVIALVSDPAAMQPAFNQGANFVVCKPLSGEIVRRTLRAATCMLYRMARRHPRRAVNTLSMVTIDGAADKAMIMQLGEGGMGIQALEPLEVSRSLKLRFEVPGTRNLLQATGEIAWADAAGRVGIRFAEIAEQDRDYLREWVFGNALETMAPRSAMSPEQARVSNSGKLFLRPAPQRLAAALLDGAIVLVATAIFELLVLGLVRTTPQAIMVQATALAIPCLFWSVYQYLFLRSVTPGTYLAAEIGTLIAAPGRSAVTEMLLAPIGATWRAIVRLGARIDMQSSAMMPLQNTGVAHISIQPPARS
jgi:CheY-like chemotaxis protein